MEHARTGPSTGSSPLVARTTLPSCTCLQPFAASWHVAPRALQPFLSGSRGALVRRSRRAHFEELSLRSSAVIRFVLLLRLLLVDVARRRAGVDPLCHCRHHRDFAAVEAMRRAAAALSPRSRPRQPRIVDRYQRVPSHLRLDARPVCRLANPDLTAATFQHDDDVLCAPLRSY